MFSRAKRRTGGTVERAEQDLEHEVARLREENGLLRAALRSIAGTAVLATGELPIAALEDSPSLLAEVRVFVDRLQN